MHPGEAECIRPRPNASMRGRMHPYVPKMHQFTLVKKSKSEVKFTKSKSCKGKPPKSHAANLMPNTKLRKIMYSSSFVLVFWVPPPLKLLPIAY